MPYRPRHLIALSAGLLAVAQPHRARAQSAPSTPSPTPSPAPSPAPTPSPTATPSPAPSPAPTPSPTATPAPTVGAAAAPAGTPTLKMSGYVQSLYTFTFDTNGDDTAANDALSMKRVRIKAKGTVWDKIGYALMFDPSTPGNLLRDAYIALGYLPHATIKIGQQKTQFGYENPESSTKLWTIDRAQVSGALGKGADLRDIGVGVLGTITGNTRGMAFEYAVTVVNGAGPNTTRDDTDYPSVWSRVGPTWNDKSRHLKLRGGVSFAAGSALATDATTMTTTGYDFVRLGGDVELDTRWLFFAAEYLMGSDSPSTGSSISKRGFYLMAAGKTRLHAGPVVKYEQYDPDTDTPDDLGQRVTLGGYWDLAKPIRMLADYELDESDKGKDDRVLVWGQVKF